jgi:hypothetical protein
MKLFLGLVFLPLSIVALDPFFRKSVNSAKSRYNSALLHAARRLDDNQNQVDISTYGVKFQKCQFIKAYSDDLAENKDSDTILGMKRFVIFRLCPDNSCSSCNSNYGEYMVDLETYLEATVEYQKKNQEEMCKACEECAVEEENTEDNGAEDNGAEDNGAEDNAAEDNAAEDNNNEEQANQEQNQDAQQNEAEAEAENADNEDEKQGEGENAEEANAGDEANEGNVDGEGRKLYSVDCSTCASECEAIQNMEANGYVEATDLTECQLIYDPEDDSMSALYAGAMCANYGKQISIGVFTDENCYFVDESKSVGDYLVDNNGDAMVVSDTLLKLVYSSSCISCANEENDNNDNQANDMCKALYEDSAKCEASHGFDSGIGDYEGYENQVAQESIVCDFIDSVSSGSYDSSGEISLFGSNSRFSSVKTSGVQTFALTFFILGTVGLAAYAAMLHSKLTKAGKLGLSSQGGAMA